MSSATPGDTYVVLVFSHNQAIREQVRTAIGRRPASDLGRIEFREASTRTEVMAAVDAGEIDLLILDAEAQPVGGFGLGYTLRQEIDVPPLMVMLVRRRDDRWLAAWAEADGTIMYPLDALEAASTVAGLLRQVTPVQ
jgi:DNA-binding response OmpR family regulator